MIVVVGLVTIKVVVVVVDVIVVVVVVVVTHRGALEAGNGGGSFSQAVRAVVDPKDGLQDGCVGLLP